MPAAPILLIEDNADDALLTRRALEKFRILNPFHCVESGEQAIEWLEFDGAEPGRDTPCPALILLDLKLPRMSGLELLAWIRGQRHLERCPVVVLTGSREAPDVQRAYELGANSYLTKPVTLRHFLELVATLDLSWELVPSTTPAVRTEPAW
jgi:two-component system response regulator